MNMRSHPGFPEGGQSLTSIEWNVRVSRQSGSRQDCNALADFRLYSGLPMPI